MAGKVQRAEVLAWMARTGRGPAEAAEHFWPRASSADLKRHKARIRKWKSRATKDAPPAPSPLAVLGAMVDEDVEVDVPHTPKTEAAAETEEDFYARMVANLEGDLQLARLAGDRRSIAALNKELRAARSSLDNARGPGAQRVPLDRNPGAVAERLVRLGPMLERLADAARRSRREAELHVIDAEE